MISNKDKEAFEKWFRNAQYSTNDDLLRLRFLEAWIAACEYKDEEIDCLQTENKKLREALKNINILIFHIARSGGGFGEGCAG